MSKSADIRSFFAVLSSNKSKSKPSTPASSSKKRAKAIESSDEDVIPETPTQAKKTEKTLKKRKVHVLSSDSEDEKVLKTKKQPQKGAKKEQPVLKPISTLDAFGIEPIKQSKVPEKPKLAEKPQVEETQVTNRKSKKNKKQKLETEVGIHNDKDFEKTLLELDDDFLMENVAELDKTIEQALSNGKASEKVPEDEKTIKQKVSQDKDTPKKIPESKNSPMKKGNSSLEDAKTPSRKRPVDHYDGDPDQERYEKKRHSAVLYQKYLNRSGPAHHGSKELPKGNPNCLKSLCFLRTGVLDSLDSDEFDALVKDHGGRTVHSVSKKVNYVVAGEEPGPAKLEKAKNYGIKIISEDELLDLILTKSGMQPMYSKNDNPMEESTNIEQDNQNEKNNKTPSKSNEKPINDTKKKLTSCKNLDDSFVESKIISGKSEEIKADDSKTKMEPKSSTSINNEKPINDTKKKSTSRKNLDDSFVESKIINGKSEEIKADDSKTKMEPKSSTSIKTSDKLELKISKISDSKPSSSTKAVTQTISKETQIETNTENKPWTEKYKPTNIKTIIGQQGDKSSMKRLMVWLQNWYKNHSGKNKPKLTKPSPWATNDDGGYFKAALLSGPPGVGKTTTANLVAKELGFDVVEFNASDTRNKRLLHEEVSQLLSTKSLAGFFSDGSAPTSKHVLLMDEVDGMAGNEDRGGMQELISLIKNSNVPIICMCNDRNHQKMRSLSNYCLDLRFPRARLEQIRGAMMSVCYKENVKIKPEALTEIITGAGMDIRQILTNLSMWSAGEQVLSAEMASKEAKLAKKDTPLGPWEVCRKVFSEEDHKTMTMGDRSRLFYHDYSLAPLFVQENYLKVMPHAPKKEHLARFAAAADAISMGDMIDTKIRRTNNWSLLDVEAMCASVLPGHYVEGHMNGQIDFPGWLGKNSKKNKFNRLLSELQAHMRTSISGSRSAVNLDYVTHLRNNIVRPLAKEGAVGISDALNIMRTYNLLREDLDSILELAQWPRQKDPMNMVDSKVKAAFTRAYNKGGAKLPYAVQVAPVKKKSGTSVQAESYEDEDDGDVEANSDDADDVTKDAMIKAKKTSNRGNKKVTEPTAGTSKGRGGKESKASGKGPTGGKKGKK